MLTFVDHAERGAWPVSGGLLDQSAWFADFVREANGALSEARREATE